MNELVENYSQSIKFTIGYAGTGKSTLLAEEATDRALVLTPTHKAKEVLQYKGVENVFTIHNVLKLVPTLDTNFRKRGKLQKLQRIGEVDLLLIDKVIIDEYSMIPMFILDMLLELLPAKAEVSIYGDSYQLPPVEGEPIEPEWYTEDITRLTTQYRAEAPEVIETFTRFVHYLERPSTTADLTLNPAIEHGDIKGFNPDTDRALCFTNAETIRVNDRIAKHLGLPSEISIGEKVSINGLLGELVENPLESVYTIYPKCISKGQLMSGDKLIATVEKIESDMSKFNQSIPDSEKLFIEIEDTVYAFHGDIDHYINDKAYKKEVEDSQLELIAEYDLEADIDLKQWCRLNKNELTRARGKAWSTYLAHQGLSFDLRRPFATTVHKAQGSEFKTIYIAQDDMKIAIRGADYTQYARLMYVALSRAIHKVIVI